MELGRLSGQLARSVGARTRVTCPHRVASCTVKAGKLPRKTPPRACNSHARTSQLARDHVASCPGHPATCPPCAPDQGNLPSKGGQFALKKTAICPQKEGNLPSKRGNLPSSGVPLARLRVPLALAAGQAARRVARRERASGTMRGRDGEGDVEDVDVQDSAPGDGDAARRWRCCNAGEVQLELDARSCPRVPDSVNDGVG